MAKFCRNCGNELKEGARFCNKCGQACTSDTPAELKAKELAKKYGCFAVLLILAFFIGGFVIIASIPLQEQETIAKETAVTDKKEEVKKEEPKKTEKPQASEAPKNAETDVKGMTEAELSYYQTAFPYISKIVEDVKQITAETSTKLKDENGIEELKVLANAIIENGNKLRKLEYTQETKTLGDLVQLFGWYISQAYENYLEWITTSDAEKFEFYQMNFKPAMCFVNEINFYSVYGIEISKQLEKDIKEVVGNSAEVQGPRGSYTTDYVFVVLNKPMYEDKRGLRNICLMNVDKILRELSKNPYYDYLDLVVKVNCDVIDSYGQEKKLDVMDMTISSEKRSKINFENFFWINIPDIADSYRYFFDGHIVD